jgi:hypothetical protein
MKISNTVVTRAGAMRCCVATVAEEYVKADSDVNVGDKSKCRYCNEPFTLIKDGNHFVWTPDWQIKPK